MVLVATHDDVRRRAHVEWTSGVGERLLPRPPVWVSLRFVNEKLLFSVCVPHTYHVAMVGCPSLAARHGAFGASERSKRSEASSEPESSEPLCERSEAICKGIASPQRHSPSP